MGHERIMNHCSLNSTNSMLVAPLVLGLLLVGGCWEDPNNTQASRTTVDPPAPVRFVSPTEGLLGDPEIVQGSLRLEPAVLDVGSISQCVGEASDTVMLINDGEEAETIEGAVTTCGCAVVEIEPGTVIQPGESRPVKVVLKPWGEPRRKLQEARFILEGRRLGPMLKLEVEIVSPLRTIPSACQRALHEDGRIRVISPDEESFALLGVEPGIPYSTLETEGPEIGIFVEWDALDEWAKSPEAREDGRIEYNDEGEWDRIYLEILTDREDCERLFIDVFNSAYSDPTWHN